MRRKRTAQKRRRPLEKTRRWYQSEAHPPHLPLSYSSFVSFVALHLVSFFLYCRLSPPGGLAQRFGESMLFPRPVSTLSVLHCSTVLLRQSRAVSSSPSYRYRPCSVSVGKALYFISINTGGSNASFLFCLLLLVL